MPTATRPLGVAVALATLLLTGAAGCDGDDGKRSVAERRSLVDSPSLAGALARSCSKLAATERLAVRCPSWLPSTRSWPGRYDGYSLSQRDFERSRCRYLTQLGYRGPSAGHDVPFHVLFGGTCRRLPLTVRDGRWPSHPRDDARDGLYSSYLRLPTATGRPGAARSTLNRPRVVDRVTVGGEAALLLMLDSYPRGGIHGGHYAIVWNRDDDGYALSLHYDRGDRGADPRPADRRALVEAAAGMVVVDARRPKG